MVKRMKIIEITFDISYLLIVLGLGVYLLTMGGVRIMWGVMALILIFGDSFHLVPRIIIAIKGESPISARYAGWGKMITSITMAVFYIFLWHIGMRVYALSLPVWTTVIYLLMVARVVLSVMPQNNWAVGSPYKWTIIRNIPFVAMGVMVILFYLLNASKGLSLVWLGVLLSFVFYVPVVVWGHKNRKLGMLMLPKSIAYIWIVIMGFAL